MKLYLVQHGEAHAKADDPERSLTSRGRADIERMARFLAGADVRADRVLHSGKRRARQTAERLAAAIAPDAALETHAGIQPNDDPRQIDWRRAFGAQDTLLVGHLPFMARLVSHLLVADERQATVAYRPGAVACLAWEETDGWRLAWMVCPELLGSMA